MKKKKITPICCPICKSDKIHHFDAEVEGWKPGQEMGVVLGEEFTGCYSWDFTAVAFECENKHGFYVNTGE